MKMKYYFTKAGNREQKVFFNDSDVKILADLGPAENDFQRRICIVKWPHMPPMLDFRKWGADGMAGKGITIHDDEIDEVINVLRNYSGHDKSIESCKKPSWYTGGYPCDECPEENGIDENYHCGYEGKCPYFHSFQLSVNGKGQNVIL